MGLSPWLIRAIRRKGYRLPTPIQRRTIPIILQVTRHAALGIFALLAYDQFTVVCELRWSPSRATWHAQKQQQ
jgi:hypothetical protein